MLSVLLRYVYFETRQCSFKLSFLIPFSIINANQLKFFVVYCTSYNLIALPIKRAWHVMMVSQSMLRELFISRIPKNIRLSLCTMPEASLDQLAMAADKMIDTMTETPREMHDLPGAKSSNLSEKLIFLENKIERLFQTRNNTAGYGSNNREVTSTSGIPQGQMPNTMQRFPTQPSEHQYNDSQYPVGLCYFHRKFGHQGGHSMLFVIYRFSLFVKSFRIRKLDFTNSVSGGILCSVRYK